MIPISFKKPSNTTSKIVLVLDNANSNPDLNGAYFMYNEIDGNTPLSWNDTSPSPVLFTYTRFFQNDLLQLETEVLCDVSSVAEDNLGNKYVKIIYPDNLIG